MEEVYSLYRVVIGENRDVFKVQILPLHLIE